MNLKRVLWLVATLLLLTTGLAAQTSKISGTVYDEAKEPVIGASVRLKSTPSKGVATNLDGRFTIEVKKGEILIISFVGYKDVEVAAQDGVEVYLEPATEILDDVVVIGYMTRKITNTSASVVKVSAKEIASKPAANPLDAVQGKVTGLQVFSSSGEPSAELSMALHGQGSIGAGTGLLFILDGMPVSTGTIKAMNPNDFESLQFLKDASATSIYGARAANGVVYITTKRGKSGERANITLRGQYGISKLANTDYFDQLMNAEELGRYYVETGLFPSKEAWEAEKSQFFGDTDFKWYDYIYQTAPLYQADIAISGGSNTSNYYLSGGGMSQKGMRAGSSYDKIFARLNLNSELNKYIRMGLNVSVSYDWTQTSPIGNSSPLGGMGATNLPFVTPYDKDGNELPYIDMLRIGTPAYEIEKNPSGKEGFITSASGNIIITPIRNLVIRSQAGIEMGYGKTFSRQKPSYRYAYGIGSAARSYGQVINFTTTNTISYAMDLGNGHDLTVLGGQEYINYTEDGISASGNGIKNDNLLSLNMAIKNRSIAENALSYAFLSFFGQFAYGYSNKYFVDLVLRNDASSRFGPNTRNGLFWSAGLLWKMKNESFLKNADWLDELDFKASFGTQGNSSVPPYYTETYAGSSGWYNGEMGIGLANIGNPDLSWERQSKLTVGVKTRMWDRIGINLEYYYRLTTDMLFYVPVDYTSGYGKSEYGYAANLQNEGAYLNQGVDLRLTADLMKGRNYYLTSYVNFNYNRDKVLELFGGRTTWLEPTTSLAYVVGQPVTFYMPIYRGVNPDTGRPQWYNPGPDPSVLTKDENDLADEYRQTLEQNTNILAYTPITGGWGLEGRWKGLFLSADFSFAIGKNMISGDRLFFENDARVRNINAESYNASRKLFNYWKQPGDIADYPSLEYQRELGKERPSLQMDSGIIEDASFMRMKNLTIGYDLPNSWLEKQQVLKSARIFFTGRNLLTFTRFQGIDPEVNAAFSYGANPNTKQFSINFELGF